MGNLKLLLRWSIRDLQQRWIQVITISIIIALGIGVYTGLSSTTPWRQTSFEESNEALNMFDLKMSLLTGGWINQTDLDALIMNLTYSESLKGIEYRISIPTTVNASTVNKSILVNGKIIGVDMVEGSEAVEVNGFAITEGRHIQSNERSENVCLVEYNFAQYYELTANNQTLQISGGYELSYIGTVLTPEYFMVVEGNLIFAESAFCALFVPLETAQFILEHSIGIPKGYINEVLFLFDEGGDITSFAQELEDEIETQYPQLSIDLMEKDEHPSYKLQLEDIPGDQEMYYIFSFLVLLIAIFGAYNLISRVVNSQRRQIGINMALGVPPRFIAIRYFLFSLEISLGGIFFGYIFALFFGHALGGVIKELIPYVVWREWLITELFIQGTLIGIIIPIFASFIPIWRAIRMQPIDAIQTGARIGTGKKFSPFLTYLRLPGSIFLQIPIRNLTRNLRRTLSTFGGIALAICVLVGVIGFMDGADKLLADEEALIIGDSENRIDVTLNNLYNATLYPVTNMTNHEDVRSAVTMLQFPVSIYSTGKSIDIIMRSFNITNEIWVPLSASELEGKNLYKGAIISQEAAQDLNVKVGDEITLEHPYRESAFRYTKQNTTFHLLAIQKSNIRFWMYCDLTANSPIFNMTGLTNSLMVLPKAGVTELNLKESFFTLPGYSSVQSVTQIVKVYEELIEVFRSIFKVLQYVVIVLAVLLVYNTTSVNMEERTRELATMGAFGTPIRITSRILMLEAFMAGVLGSVTGYFLLSPFIVTVLENKVTEAMDEIGLTATLTLTSLGVLIVIGVILVTIIPLLSVRKLMRMDLPSALRVSE